MNEKELLAQLQAQLERKLEPFHDAAEHAFEPSDEDPSICKVCGWMGPNGRKLDCDHTAREHAEIFLSELKAGKISLDEPIVVIEVIVTPRRRSFWDLFN